MQKLFTLAVLLSASSCWAENEKNLQDYLKIQSADRIVIQFAPRANFNARVQQREVKDAKAIQSWLKACANIPAESPQRLLIKFTPKTPEHRIEFFEGEKLLGTLRMKGGRLDAPAGDGWDFYSQGEDQVLTSLVKKSFE